MSGSLARTAPQRAVADIGDPLIAQINARVGGNRSALIDRLSSLAVDRDRGSEDVLRHRAAQQQRRLAGVTRQIGRGIKCGVPATTGQSSQAAIAVALNLLQPGAVAKKPGIGAPPIEQRHRHATSPRSFAPRGPRTRAWRSAAAVGGPHPQTGLRKRAAPGTQSDSREAADKVATSHRAGIPRPREAPTRRLRPRRGRSESTMRQKICERNCRVYFQRPPKQEPRCLGLLLPAGAAHDGNKDRDDEIPRANPRRHVVAALHKLARSERGRELTAPPLSSRPKPTTRRPCPLNFRSYRLAI